MGKKDRIVCGLDIGTTKICALIARVHEGNHIEIVSTGYAQSGGLKRGIVVDLEEAAASIRRAAEEAELKSGVSIDWVTAGVSGDHIQSFNCHGAVSIEGKNHEVTAEDVTQVIHAARSVPVPPERDIIHVLPQEFFLDNRGSIQNPVGLTGSRLDVNIHVVTCDESLTQNLINAVNRAEMRVSKVVLQQLASAEAVLTPDEKELGVAVIDIGGGTTDIALFVKNSIRSTSVLPVGGDHFTHDLAIGLRTATADAERIKKEFGSVCPDAVAGDEVIKVSGVGTREPSSAARKLACEILRDRAVEVLELIKDRIDRAGEKEQLVAGAILTGGGSLLEGMLELSEEILQMPVRQGLPRGIQGLTEELSHPVYATAIGLALHGAQENGARGKSQANSGSPPRLLNRFLSWIGR